LELEIINWEEFLLPYEHVVDELCAKFNNLAKENTKFNRHSPIEQVVGRVKDIGSILEKANRKGIPYNEIDTSIEDIAGVRIICKFVEDIEKVVETIRARDGKDLKIIEERDYITNTKKSGYRSYHLILKYNLMMSDCSRELFCEVQIRTLAMNFWATLEHSLRYKYNDNLPEHLKKRLEASAQAAFNLDKEIGLIRDEIIKSQDVITQKNELVDKIMKKIAKLYAKTSLKEANNLNMEFNKLYAEEDFEKLAMLNDKLNIMLHLYETNF